MNSWIFLSLNPLSEVKQQEKNIGRLGRTPIGLLHHFRFLIASSLRKAPEKLTDKVGLADRREMGNGLFKSGLIFYQNQNHQKPKIFGT